MSKPTYDHNDGAGPKLEKRKAIDWSIIVKPSIGYDI